MIFRHFRNLPPEFSIPEKLPPEKVIARSNFLKKKFGKKIKGRTSEVNLRMGPKMKYKNFDPNIESKTPYLFLIFKNEKILRSYLNDKFVIILILDAKLTF